MIDDTFISDWAQRLSADIPGALAVVLKGSYVRGDAEMWSDVDFDVLVDDTDIEDAYLTWFDDTRDRIVHVSVAVKRLWAWLDDFEEPTDWAFGFAGHPVTRLLWVARPSLAAELDRPDRIHPQGEPELEDFIESLGKARNAFYRGDELAVRLALREVGNLAPSLLIPLNRPQAPATKPEALRLALDLAVAPRGYREEMLALLGYDGLAYSVAELMEIGERFVLRMLEMLQHEADLFSPLLAPHLGPALCDGTLQRYLAQQVPFSPEP